SAGVERCKAVAPASAEVEHAAGTEIIVNRLGLRGRKLLRDVRVQLQYRAQNGHVNLLHLEREKRVHQAAAHAIVRPDFEWARVRFARGLPACRLMKIIRCGGTTAVLV